MHFFTTFRNFHSICYVDLKERLEQRHSATISTPNYKKLIGWELCEYFLIKFNEKRIFGDIESGNFDDSAKMWNFEILIDFTKYSFGFGKNRIDLKRWVFFNFVPISMKLYFLTKNYWEHIQSGTKIRKIQEIHIFILWTWNFSILWFFGFWP